MNTFNPPAKSEADLSQILNSLGSFYVSFEDSGKALLKTYFQGILSGLEALYYDLDEAANAYDIGADTSFIDLSYNDLTLDFVNNAELVRLETVSTLTPTYTAASGTYNYYVTAVDAYGVETPSSKVLGLLDGPDTLGAGTSVLLEWGAIEGTTNYYIYRGDYHIGTTTLLEYEDIGAVGTEQSGPTQNETFKEFLVTLPFTGYDIVNISVLKEVDTSTTLVEGTDYTLSGTKKLSFIDKTAYTGTIKNYYTLYTYAFLPILKELYLSKLLYPSDPSLVYLNKEYSHYIDVSQITSGYDDTEKSNRAWAFHLNKLIHNISLVARKSTTVSNLAKLYSLIQNVPFAYSAGTITNITTAGAFITFTIGDENYSIPSDLSLLYVENDAIEKYALLVASTTLQDLYSTDTVLTPAEGTAGSFSENKDIIFNTPKAILLLNFSTTIQDTFVNKIVPMHLKAVYTSPSSISPDDIEELDLWYRLDMTTTIDGVDPDTKLGTLGSVQYPQKTIPFSANSYWEMINNYKVPLVTNTATGIEIETEDPELNMGFGRNILTVVLAVKLGDPLENSYLFSIANGGTTATDKPRYTYWSLYVSAEGSYRVKQLVEEVGQGWPVAVEYLSPDGECTPGEVEYFGISWDGPNQELGVYHKGNHNLITNTQMVPGASSYSPPYEYDTINQRQFQLGGYGDAPDAYPLAFYEASSYTKILTTDEMDGIFLDIEERFTKVPGTLGGEIYVNGDMSDGLTDWHTANNGVMSLDGSELKLESTSGTGSVYKNASGPIIEGLPYRATLTYRTAADVVPKWTIYDDTNYVYLIPYTEIPTSTSLNTITYDFIVPAGSTSIRIGLAVYDVADVAWINTVSFKEIYS